MPARFANVAAISAGIVLLQPNPRRVMLQINCAGTNAGNLLIGDNLANGLVYPLQQGGGFPLLVNVHGTAIQGTVSVLTANSAVRVTACEIFQTADGST